LSSRPLGGGWAHVVDDEGDEVELIVERRPAALDVQKAQVTACVRVADERLGTTSIDLQAIDPEGIIRRCAHAAHR
jgi:hypothetical protein